jgi:ABC-type bacteriocin/lantibiotic exporter with double-glycine peptidase domain
MARLNFRRPLRRRVPVVHQMEMAECGAACLAMVLGFHGRHVPLPEMREACAVTRDGANAYNLLGAARRNGLDAKALKLEHPEELRRLPLPAILHWDFNHFVVLEEAGRETLAIVDPNGGRQVVSLREAGRRFTGIVLCFKPAAGFQPRAASRPSLGRYRALLASVLPNLGQILLATLVLQLLGLVAPIASLLLVDRVIMPRQLPWMWGLGFALGITIVARALSTLVRSWVLQGLQNALDASLMGRFLDHLLHLPLAFFLRRETGDLVQRVQSNAILRQLFTSQSLSALLDSILLLSYALLMLAFHWRLGLVVVAFGVARVLLFLALRERNRRIMAAELAGAGRENAGLVTALSGLETTRAIGGADRMVARWVQPMAATLNRQIERRRLEINVEQAATLLKALALAAVFLIGGHAVMAQEITLGVFAAFLTLQTLFMQPLESLMQAVAQLQYLGTHLHRLDDVLETPAEVSGRERPALAGAIELRNVDFGYSAHAPRLLHDISLSVARGEKIAIVGRSGAGKSTLARLLLGMHLPDAGTIRFDGIDMREFDLPWLRRQMGVVQQETFLFDDSVRANLSLNDPELPLERLRWAARLACIDEAIEALPQGYRNRVGENGCFLSGGQRQRLAIARAVAHSPAILLLDEATSSLDLDTESRIHANLAQLGCTRIVIAHRLATVMDADRILVLDGGRLVQQGTYRELVGQGGLFHAMAESFDALAEVQHA